VARLEGVRAQRARLQGVVATTRVALWTLAGEEDHSLGVVEVEAPSLPDPGDRESLVAQAFAQRPELLATREARNAQREAEKAARAGMWPRLMAQGNASYANPNLRYLPPEERFQTSWDVSAVLSYSPNEASVSRRTARALAADRAATEADLSALADGIRVEVTQAFEEVRASQRATQAARASQEAAEEAYRVRRVQLDAGAAVFTDVLESDLEVTRARLRFLQATLDLRAAHALAARKLETHPLGPRARLVRDVGLGLMLPLALLRWDPAVFRGGMLSHVPLLGPLKAGSYATTIASAITHPSRPSRR